MNTLSIPVVAIASISFYVGIYHLLIYFRQRQNRADLTFALLCFTIVFYDAFCAGLYNATSLLEGVQWQRAQFVVLAIFVLTFLWFVSDYTHQKPGSSIYLFSAFYLVAFIIQLVDRSNLTFLLNSPSIKHITLFHAHTYYEAALGPFTAIQSLMGVVASTCVLAMGIRYFRGGYKREAIPLILGIMFMYAAGVNDMLVSNGVYDAIYLIEYAYTAMILMTTYSLSNTVVEAAIAKDELRKSKERFRALVETTSDWVWEINANGVYTYASPTVRDLLGYEPEEILGKTPCDLMPADEAERCSVIFRDIIFQKKLLESVENVNQRKDGRLVTLETSGVPFFASDGSLLGYRGIDRDITERKLAEQALQAKTKELDLYFLSSLDLLCIADTNGYFRRVNPEWETTLGYAVNELEGRQFLEFVHPEDVPATMAAISRLADQQQVLNFENRYRCKDGSYRWIEWRSYPSGQMIYAVARDITERKQIERELRENEERYRMLVEVSPTATWIARNDILTFANPAALRILGATDPGQVVGRPALDFIHPDYHAAVKERITQMRGEGKIAPLLEEKYVRLDGSIVDVEVVAAPFTTSNGAIIQVFFQDITKRKQAEEALRKSEARHRTLIESQTDLVSRYLPDTTLTFVNDAYCKFFGKTHEELIGQSYMFMIVPKYRGQVAADTKRL
ncbi:MAG TPA: PAS domain S-box protein, partial [Anaerolineales bacterium]|nr:PAS domain S-box protein [Anaerolineales bacterium]